MLTNIKQYIIMQRASKHANLTEKFAGGCWQEDSGYYLMDEHGNEYPILHYYDGFTDDFEFFCENSGTTAYPTIAEFVRGNNDALDIILNIANPFHLSILDE